jgi:hypothetical protein
MRRRRRELLPDEWDMPAADLALLHGVVGDIARGVRGVITDHQAHRRGQSGTTIPLA